MTTWCDHTSCTHNADGRCALYAVHLRHSFDADGRELWCEEYAEKQASGSRLLVDDPLEGWY